MVFKRRDKRPIWQIVTDFFYPRGGWARAYRYVKHRMHRLPDPPDRIARGIFAGVAVCFTPFFGFHFFWAVIVAKLMRGNIFAALLATFFGNPVTFPIIGALSLSLGHFMLGTTFEESANATLVAKFIAAGADFKDNFFALFTDKGADWSNLSEFYSEVYLPYLVGGLAPGVIAGTIAYYLSVPVITVYKNRRKGRLKKKLEELRKKALKKADETRSKR
ncbi:DUF2062 domain-containing protein [Pseudohalocynthiibacter aestuariivivens]|uniref:DUF2062 domain-containing protein n=1 Tax=Pseudohalocynthiibacter aestuariivivens TaxID=1591409 RepID=A0ABV5JH86_9RHOB|nr:MULTISPECIES: DUF2062 domain-containing protein [Pseudohalocynthiibacter]MBS9715466.1 DUF2062 domain-containing protein [Pseudohalocynthiibacter aestuariivivens]MCK0102588.1 DUF2062 domain-containing protein [Pseudohalocynthiibacter sp. F2068]